MRSHGEHQDSGASHYCLSYSLGKEKIPRFPEAGSRGSTQALPGASTHHLEYLGKCVNSILQARDSYALLTGATATKSPQHPLPAATMYQSTHSPVVERGGWEQNTHEQRNIPTLCICNK